MTRNVRLMFWGAGALAVVLAWAFGPVFAGYALAGAAFAVIFVLMGTRVVRAIRDWRLEHPWRPGHTRTHLPSGRTEERRAA